MIAEVTIYLNRDNTFSLQLSQDGTPITHTSITRAQLTIGSTLYDSNTYPTLFDFTAADKVTFKFGAAAGLAVGRYKASLVVYDATHTNGVVYGSFIINVKTA